MRVLHAGEEATKLEKLLGVTVLRHKCKKPEGGADELEAHFGCARVSSKQHREAFCALPANPGVGLIASQCTLFGERC